MKVQIGKSTLDSNNDSSRAGEMVLIDFPFTNLKGSKVRPGLILGQGDREGDYIVAFVTSEINSTSRYRHAIRIAQADLTSGSLRSTSVVRTDKTAAIHQGKFYREKVARLTPSKLREVMQSWASVATRNYSQIFHQANRPAEDQTLPFVPGETTIPYAGRVFTEDEVEAAVRSTLDFWLTLGSEGAAFEKELAGWLGVKHSLLVNSGSSANLVAVSTLTTHKLPAHRRIQSGDEVITVAAGFPTTVAPILQIGAIPVFIDNNPVTGNVWTGQLESAYVISVRCWPFAGNMNYG
jgi:DegT/DnrJ/EryC1/StrS aminotransferase family/PemK-like, MazF-like toxin of type II toxin-antitoxin system